MNKHVCKAFFIILGLLVLSCSRAAPRGPLPISSAVACTSNTDCTKNNEICDTIFNNGTDTGKGSCRQICDPHDQHCPGGDFCNPINGLCETSCGQDQESSNFCSTQFAADLGTGYTSSCIADNYCALQPNGTNCPSGFKPSGGFCKPSVSYCSRMQALKPDLITGTCEVPCVNNQDCTVLNYTPAAASSTQVNFACSPITSTCVPQCNNTSTTPVECTGTRNACYVPGSTLNTANTLGTCEQGCPSSSCLANVFQCAEGVCQQSCTSSADCKANTNTKKTVCDVISGVCRVGCTSGTCSSGLACSPITSTCVQQCPIISGQPCFKGEARDTCYTPGTTTQGSCEKGCPGGTCPTTLLPGFPKGLQCEESICQQKCQTITVPASPKTDNSDCSQNTKTGRTTCDYVSSVCRAGCSSGIPCPTGQGLSCSIVSGTCVATCAPTVTCPTNRNTCATPALDASAYGVTCEQGCLTKGVCPNGNLPLSCAAYNDIASSVPSSVYFCLINSSSTGTNGSCPVGLSNNAYTCGYNSGT